MLMDMMTRIYPELSYTQIENLLLRMSVSDAGSLERNSLTQEYFTYVIDTLLSIIIRENTTIASKNIFLS